MLFPGALGDLLCCWPGIDGLIASGYAVTLASRMDLSGVLPPDGLRLDSIERREITDLFANSPIALATRAYFAGFDRIDSFTGASDPAFAARLSAAAGRSVSVHPFRGMGIDDFAFAYYARCLGTHPRVRVLPVAVEAEQWAAALWHRHQLGTRALAIHPGSGGVAKNWEGMAALADEWRRAGGTVVAVLGPAEIELGTTIPADVVLDAEPLPHVAAVLRRAHRSVGNDSGISHLAGLVGAQALVLFADSDPMIWAPVGAGVGVQRAAPTCRRCGPGRFCVHRLPVEFVQRALY
ncbi:MAG TPA: glycosyltransferase family 9 protein [Candidatus Dormibacteraeota bacterium]|nr:glycosyltransferase family 9 protein [Candidatus Dormibacteraeota bacterium]